MTDTPKGMVDIEVEITDEEAALLVMVGMFTREGKVLVITPKGSERLKAWCDEQLERSAPR
jgi:hypothetical protein